MQQTKTRTRTRTLTWIVFSVIAVIGVVMVLSRLALSAFAFSVPTRIERPTPRRRPRNLTWKRAFDVVVAGTALVLSAPTLLVIAVLVRVKLGGPVIFKQQRPGLHGKPFTMYKFRTMTDARDADGKLLPDAARLTPFGKLLRKTSLDELPELLNVLKGDMSLVGPRPLLMRYLSLYTPEQARRHEIKPGITGWAQVNGRNNISWEEKFALDVFYVDNVNLWMDLRILVQTVVKTLRSEDVSQAGHATCEAFTGSAVQAAVQGSVPRTQGERIAA